jgi:hypothetical protein
MIDFTNSFPGVGNGNPTLDTAAFNQAVANVSNTGNVIYFSTGIYTFNERIDITDKRLKLLGDGKGITHLKWIDPQNPNLGAGLNVSGTSAGTDDTRPYFEIEGLSLATDYVAQGQTALSLTWRYGHADPRKKIRIRDIEIRPWNKYASAEQVLGLWEAGIQITNPGGVDISHTDIYGTPGYGSKCGIYVKTDPTAQVTSIRHFLSNLYVYGFEDGIVWEGGNPLNNEGLEGVYFSNFEIVWCGNGYTGNHVLGHHLSNGHMDCLWNGARFSGRSVQVKLSNIDFHQSYGNPEVPLQPMPGNLVSFVDTFRMSVENCQFLGFDDKPTTPHSNGIFTKGSAHGLFVGNHFDGIKDNDIVFGPGTRNCHAVANRLRRFIDQGDGTNSCALCYPMEPQ